MNEMQFPVCAPRVKEYMLKSEYWIEQVEDAECLILNKEEINDLNEKTFKQMESKGLEEALYDLEKFPLIITKEKLLNTMKAYSSKEIFPVEPQYDASANEISKSVKEEILNQANYEGIPDKIQVKFGMLVKREDVRAFPTDIVFAREAESIDVDLFQLTSLPAGSPVAILHKSKNSQWYYIQSTLYKGWVKVKSIALARDRKEILDYLKTDRFLVITGSKVETEPNPFLKEVSNVLFQMGDRIPLVESNEVPQAIPEGSLQAQSPEGCYVVRIPARDDHGYFQFKLALIARSNDIHEGYLPYTKKNIIRQAFKLLGERYGWGGMFGRRDCSQFIMDIYRAMGFIIPRNASMQEEGAAGKFIKFTGSIKDRENTLNRLEAGDPIYMKGHVVMYLGKIENSHYMIHSGAGYGMRNEDGSVKPVTVHGVFVMELHQLLMSGEKSYLEAFTTARQFQ